MSVVRVGSTKKYAEGWETAFRRKKVSAGKTARPKKTTGRKTGTSSKANHRAKNRPSRH